MSESAQILDERLAAVVVALGQSTLLATAVAEGVDGFFARHPELERNPWTERIASVVIFERLTTAAPQTAAAQKVA